MRRRVFLAGLGVLGALLLGCLLCVWRMHALSDLLPDQHAAERWQGDSDMDFSQFSLFMARDEKLSRDGVYAFRSEMIKKLEEASLDPRANSGLLHDAWSTSLTLKAANGQRSASVEVIPVGGGFFDFHPLRLISGNYLRAEDVMDDRVLLDKETAWMLFGGTDLTGMSFTLEGAPFVVAGVYEHASDSFSRSAEGDGMRIYMSYAAFERLLPERSGITCYELVMANPVRGFVRNAVAEKFPVKSAETVENSGRFSAERLYALLKEGSRRSMRTGEAVYPAWENAARAVEDRAAQYLVAAAALGLLPIVLLGYQLLRLVHHGRRRLGDDYLPEAHRRLKELYRVRARQRWERRHPDMR